MRQEPRQEGRPPDSGLSLSISNRCITKPKCEKSEFEEERDLLIEKVPKEMRDPEMSQIILACWNELEVFKHQIGKE